MSVYAFEPDRDPATGEPLLDATMKPEDERQVRALYNGAVAAADAAIGRLLQGLHDEGLADDTIVVLLADHGENLYDETGRGMGHGDHLEGSHSLQIPLLIYDPVHRFPAHAVPGIVRDIDLVPKVARKRKIRAALSNSFGFGGTNASLVLRRWQGA